MLDTTSSAFPRWLLSRGFTLKSKTMSLTTRSIPSMSSSLGYAAPKDARPRETRFNRSAPPISSMALDAACDGICFGGATARGAWNLWHYFLRRGAAQAGNRHPHRHGGAARTGGRDGFAPGHAAGAAGPAGRCGGSVGL